MKNCFMTGIIAMMLAVPTPRAEAQTRLWGNIEYKGKPWVENISSPRKISHGLQNRHIALWASHGRYYDKSKASWQWQRPKLFSTTEDLYTQTIVVPYLMPMLENAGAVVFSPRERDWQRYEVIVDNDTPNPGTSYIEVDGGERWQRTTKDGFAIHGGYYHDGENPFTAGTARQVRATKKKKNYSLVSYQPYLPSAGRYAVYVSYQTQPKSVDDAHYIVWHKGEKTEFHVNQQMGGGTWVYLGTFDFDSGSNEFNRVVITNQSRNKKGIVTTDAVRFGGGTGNIERGGSASGLPRALECARYYAQWAGMPYDIYSVKGGSDDYSDDINVRPLMTNYLAGGSCYVPALDGLGVPLELSLAIHSDAGFSKNGSDLVGSLAIYTTDINDGRLNSGLPRLMAKGLAESLLANAKSDIEAAYGKWTWRYLWDRNYAETRIPEIPGAIFETLSHQNFPDMVMGQDPNFRFTLARSIYKSILRYVNGQHGESSIITPLAPDHFSVELKSDEARLSWSPVRDPQEPSAEPTGYIVYTAVGDGDFDNGTYVKSTDYKLKLEPDVLYSFKVAAVNKGGRSFTTEVLSALYNPIADKTIMIVNGFQRLASPAVRNTATEQGFDFDVDPGITMGRTAGWIGKQVNFNKTRMGINGSGGLGWSNDQFFGQFMAGNDFNYVRTHAAAIQSAGRYSIASCSRSVLESGTIRTAHYPLIDLLLGQERNDGYSLIQYKTFTPQLRSILQNYTVRGGNLLVSGSYIGSDMQAPDEQLWLNNVLKCNYLDQYREPSDTIQGMGTTFLYHHTLNELHYASTASDVLVPTSDAAFATMLYGNGTEACVAYDGNDYRVITMGFPFECIRDEKKRASIMQGLLNFLLK